MCQEQQGGTQSERVPERLYSYYCSGTCCGRDVRNGWLSRVLRDHIELHWDVVRRTSVAAINRVSVNSCLCSLMPSDDSANSYGLADVVHTHRLYSKWSYSLHRPVQQSSSSNRQGRAAAAGVHSLYRQGPFEDNQPLRDTIVTDYTKWTVNISHAPRKLVRTGGGIP